MKNEIVTSCYQLVAAMVNGTYQGILITALVAASLRMLRRTNAATRSAVWFGTLLLLALIIPAHYLCSRWHPGISPAAVETPVSAVEPQPDSNANRIEASSLPSDREAGQFAADVHFPENNAGFEDDYTREQQGPIIAASGGTNSQPSDDPVRPFVLAILEAATNSVEENATSESGLLPQVKQKLSWLGERLVRPLSWKIAP